MRKRSLCIKCGKYVRINGSYYCAECKAEAVRLEREKKRAYMKAYWVAKKAAKEAAQAAAIAEAAETAAAELIPPQPGQWTTTSITTVTTNGENPPTVHTETKTEPVRKKRVYTRRGPGEPCVRCGKAPKKPGRSYCAECEKAKNREYFRARYAKEKLEAATGERTGCFAKPCIKCGNPERVPGKSFCRDCYNAILRARKAIKRGKPASPRPNTEKTPTIVQQNVQNNAPTVVPEKAATPPIPEIPKVAAAIQPELPFDAPEKAPLVVQQNIQNNAPASAEKPAVLPDTINVNVTSPIKVEHNHPSVPYAFIGYVMAAVFFLIWIGTVFKHWVR